MNNEHRSTTVLVTGGSGYLAGWLIVGLLRQGYSVRVTLRNLAREREVRAAIATQVVTNQNITHQSSPHQISPDQISPDQISIDDRLTFVAADLMSDAGWSDAMAGCTYALHAASPMGQGEPRGTDLVGPAREGTLRVLAAAAASGVRRVVATSSLIAAQGPTVAQEQQPITDETTWTDTQQKGLSEYGRSKTLAEQAAWAFIDNDSSGLTLATILPGMILGPVMTEKVSGSVEVVSRLLTGKVPAIPRLGFSITDVRDLVDLQLKAMTHPDAANQRLIGVGDFLWFSEIADILRRQFPSHAAKIPKRRLPTLVVRLAGLFQEEARFMAPLLNKRREFVTAKAADLLDWRPRPSKDAVIDCGEGLLAQKLV